MLFLNRKPLESVNHPDQQWLNKYRDADDFDGLYDN